MVRQSASPQRFHVRQRRAVVCEAICAATVGLTETLNMPLLVKLVLTACTTAVVTAWFAARDSCAAAVAMLAEVSPALSAAA